MACSRCTPCLGQITAALSLPLTFTRLQRRCSNFGLRMGAVIIAFCLTVLIFFLSFFLAFFFFFFCGCFSVFHIGFSLTRNILSYRTQSQSFSRPPARASGTHRVDAAQGQAGHARRRVAGRRGARLALLARSVYRRRARGSTDVCRPVDELPRAGVFVRIFFFFLFSIFFLFLNINL